MNITHLNDNSVIIKFSVLLPTKDRLDLLKYAVDSILNQTYSNWELIISDNFSKADIKSYVEGLNDDRIIYSRTEKYVSVTKNWNNTQDKANGDYIIMLGDDDALLPDFFEKCKKYLEEYQYPELLNFGAYHYLQANVSPQYPDGYILSTSKSFYPYMTDYTDSYLLDVETRKSMVQKSLNFNFQFAFNMQYFLYSKELAFKLTQYGKVYEAPYPDFYSANAMMLLSKEVLIIPEDMLILGITPKSYGYYYLNNKEKKGMAFHNESNFREHANQSVKGKMCNVAEMETAALATFAHFPKRFTSYNLKIDLITYYKAVIRRIVKDYDKKTAWKILFKEVFLRVPILDWYMYYKYISIGMERKIANPTIVKNYDMDKGYENISLLIKDIVNGAKINNIIT